MVPTSAATAMFLMYVFFAAVLGIGVGGFACLLLRQSWGFKTTLIDAVLAAAVVIIAAYLVSAIDNARGVWESRIGLVLTLAAASVLLRHVFRLVLRFAR
jgi:hypothetical protein